MAKQKRSILSASEKLDRTLDALFSTSSGPIRAPKNSRFSDLIAQKSMQESHGEEEEANDEDADSDDSLGGFKEDNGDAPDATKTIKASKNVYDGRLNDDAASADSKDDDRGVAAQLFSEAQECERKWKNKRKQDVFNDLESKYFHRIADEEPPASKRRKPEAGKGMDAQDLKAEKEEYDGNSATPIHESIMQNKQTDEIEKASRTVFLSNVSIEVVSSKKAKKSLLSHLSSIFDKDTLASQSIESIRFRSVPFSTAAMPKRAAFITKNLMDATTHTTNAYAVYSSSGAARIAQAKLNGSVVLGRHLRVDSVAHPTKIDHRRCVFVGNLGFVDDETLLNVKVDGEGKGTTEKRKRNKVPMDVEEGLWQTFGEHAGKVESVRVVRDQATRVGKGIAYVQFYDGNSVESALILNGKKFPPMLPRELRVSRCKAPQKTARAMDKKAAEKIAALAASGKGKQGTMYARKFTAEEQTMAGRAGKLLGHSAAARARLAKPGGRKHDQKKRAKTSHIKDVEGRVGFKTPEAIVFEGRRASSKDGKPRDLKMKGGKTKFGTKSKKPAK